jgi:hypothetical protein
VGAITTTKLRVPTDILDVDKCLAWSDEEVEQATVRLETHRWTTHPQTAMDPIRWSAHRRGKLESNSYMHRIRKPKTSQPHPTAATQQPESSTSSRKRAPHRPKDLAEPPRNDPIVPKRSRPADNVRDPDPAESSVAHCWQQRWCRMR